MADGKDLMAGMNWIDQFTRNCAHEGHTDMIEKLTDMHSVSSLINDCEETFGDDSPEGNDCWIARAYSARECEFKLCK